MTPEQQAAYVNGQAACALIEMYVMNALNHEKMMKNKSLAYDEEAFMKLQEKYCISHNAVVSFFLCQQEKEKSWTYGKN